MTFRGRLLLAASWLACRLPEGPAFRFADFAGDLWYRFKPGRADQAADARVDTAVGPPPSRSA